MLMEHFEVKVLNRVGFEGYLHCKVKNRTLPRGNVRLAMINGDLICNKWLFLKNSQQGTMGNHTIKTLVRRTCGHDDHFTLGFGQITFLEH